MPFKRAYVRNLQNLLRPSYYFSNLNYHRKYDATLKEVDKFQTHRTETLSRKS